MKEIKTITQTDVTGIMDYLAAQIKGWKPDVIVAIAKGGFIPARLLAKKLNVSKIVSYGINFYDKEDHKMDTPVVYQDLTSCRDLLTVDTKILLVDDIVDTGDSIKYCVKHLVDDIKCCNINSYDHTEYIDSRYLGTASHENTPNIKTCSLYTKFGSSVSLNYCFDEIDSDTWAVFFWE